MTRRIDSHQHYWRTARGDYGWLTPDLGPICRDFLPADLAPLIADCGIEATILVQAAPTVAETEFLLDIAAKTPSIAGVVGWVDFDAPEVVADIARLARNPKLVGLRPMIHDIADEHWMLRPAFDRVFRTLSTQGLVFDALVRPPHLPHLDILATRYPDLPIVVDHGAKPLIATGIREPWARNLSRLAMHGNVVCKLSGLVTEAGADWSAATLRPFMDLVADTFGTRRILFGSDWPVLNLAGTYRQWFDIAKDFVASRADLDIDAVFGGNAARIYLARSERE